ncbi:uncharacterized protein LOC125944149 isoform X2 [Dermacentor silvarum]|uniref:uncharacterized protein LOC125944149 isoform X2 n=1 Tax=Dermacentor silvarum TaxID=543639 RepID=UPI0021007CBA|nr:uncharacterized protein LOC125944149 isoform X2 [Dermacentor silvarum]
MSEQKINLGGYLRMEEGLRAKAPEFSSAGNLRITPIENQWRRSDTEDPVYPEPARNTPTQPRYDGVSICIDEAQGRRSSTSLITRALNCLLFLIACSLPIFICGTLFVAIVLFVVSVTFIIALSNYENPAKAAELLILPGATALMVLTLICGYRCSSIRSTAVRLAPSVQAA